MSKSTEIKILTKETSESIDKLNDTFFEVVKNIYSANFVNAKISFLGTSETIEAVFQYSKQHNQYYEKKIKFDINEVAAILQEIINDFEKKDYQEAADVLLYDFSSIFNEYNDELKKCL